MSEEIIYQNADITITRSRFMVGSKTYAIRNIVTTKGLHHDPSWFRRLVFKEYEKYEVVLQTTAGEVSAYESSVPDSIGDIIEALDKAIALQ
jgi:hypothetical protein